MTTVSLRVNVVGFRSAHATRNFSRPFSQTLSNRSTRFLRPRHDDEHEKAPNTMLRMLMFGKPGAGKGTLTSRLVKRYDIVSLSTGDLLRQHIVEKTPIGLQAESIVAEGGFLPDELMLKVVTSNLNVLADKHWILDGFPRTLGQAQMLDKHLRHQGTPLSLVVNLDVPDEVILSRISDRYVHLKSGRVYNLSFNPPIVAGLDDVTGEPLTKRPDDNPETFARRLEKFYESTSPLISYYSGVSSETIPDAASVKRRQRQHPHQISFVQRVYGHRLELRTLSGTTSDQIWPHLEKLVKTSFPSLKERSTIESQLGPAFQEQGSLASLRNAPLFSLDPQK